MNTENLIKELNFKAIRSSGPGGQHANKVSSKIELTFDLEKSTELIEEQKTLLSKNLANRLTKENILILFFFSSRRRHTRSYGDWSSDVCSSDLLQIPNGICSPTSL